MQSARPEDHTSTLALLLPVAGLLLVQLLNGVVVAAQRYFFPIYASEALGLTAVLVSTLVSLAQIAGMFAAILGGGLIDTLGRKWTLVAGLLGFVVSGLAFLTRVPWLVAALWAVGGLAMALASLGAQSYLIRAAGGGSLGLSSALYHWGFTLGGAIGSPIAGRILDVAGYEDYAWLVIGLAGITALSAVVLMPRLQRTGLESQGDRGIGALRGYFDIVRDPLVLRLALMRFLPTCYYGMSTVLIPLLIYAAVGTKTSVAVFATASQILATLAQLVTGRAADRLGPRTPTVVAMGAVALAALGQGLFAGQLWGLFAFGCLGVAAAWSLSTLMPVLVSSAASSAVQGRVLGTLNLLWNLAMTLSALVGGALVEVILGLPFIMASVLVAIGVLVALSFFRRLAALRLSES